MVASVTAPVMSISKGRYPPTWVPTGAPSTQTVAWWWTAPKCSTRRWPCHWDGVSTRRRYQPSDSQCAPIPDAAVSQLNGTVIC